MKNLTTADLEIIDQAFETFKCELNAFLEGRLPNLYVYGEDVIAVYTRKGYHMIQETPFHCLDIASITISQKYQGHGLGMRVIDHMHQINPFRVTYVESLLNDRLHARLLKEHWIEVTRGEFAINPPCVYKFKPLKT